MLYYLALSLLGLTVVDCVLVAIIWRAQTLREREAAASPDVKPQTDGGPGIPPASK